MAELSPGGVFVDTSAWDALADRGDRAHPDARSLYQRLRSDGRSFVTTNNVISESYTLIARRGGYDAAHTFLRVARDSAFVRRVFVPEEWESEAEGLLARYHDQEFSYVDATSFVVMRRLGLREAFAFDQQFATAGFTVLRPPR